MKQLLSVRALEIGLIVLGLGIWFFVVVVVGNVQTQLQELTETSRSSELNRLQQSLEFYYIDKSIYPTAISEDPLEICDTEAETLSTVKTDCAGVADLRELVPSYIGRIPRSGQDDTDHTGYWIWISEITNKAVISRENKK